MTTESTSKTEEKSKVQKHAKINVIKPADDDKEETCRTFVIHKEDHTLGNSLRYMTMKDARVEFCGYTVPHPSEEKINFRIQTVGCSAEDALRSGLANLKDACAVIDAKFDEALKTHSIKPEPMDE